MVKMHETILNMNMTMSIFAVKFSTIDTDHRTCKFSLTKNRCVKLEIMHIIFCSESACFYPAWK